VRGTGSGFGGTDVGCGGLAGWVGGGCDSVVIGSLGTDGEGRAGLSVGR